MHNSIHPEDVAIYISHCPLTMEPIDRSPLIESNGMPTKRRAMDDALDRMNGWWLGILRVHGKV